THRLRQALAAAAQETRDLQRAVSDKVGAHYGAIFGVHVALIEDATLAREVETLIRDQGFAAEYAVSRVMRRHVKAFESIDRGHLGTRAADLYDIEKRILLHLLGQRREQVQQLKEAVMV